MGDALVVIFACHRWKRQRAEVIISGFQSVKQMPRLAAAILKMTASAPSKIRGGNYGNEDHYYAQIASELMAEGKHEEAIQMWRLVMSRASAQNNGAEAGFVLKLCSSLVALDRRKEIEDEIAKIFFPTPRPKRLLGYDAPLGGAWMGIPPRINRRSPNFLPCFC